MFSASIFYPKKSKQFDFTLSEKLNLYSFVIFISYWLFFLFIEKLFGFRISGYSIYFLIIPLIIYVSGAIIRLNEYENLNGTFAGTLSFENDYLIIDSDEYQYNKIENLIVFERSYFGQKNNTRSGPMYSNGTNNKICFMYENEKIAKYFKLDSKRHIDELQSTLLKIITNERIPYQRKYLNLINMEFRSLIQFELFIAKLIKEKRIECTEGLLLIGYDSDNKAKGMRSKYCC